MGEIRDRSFAQQSYRASCLNLVTAAVVLWITVYLERATNALRGHGQTVDDALLQYLPVAAGMGAHQSHGRLLLAQQCQDLCRQIQAATASATGLTGFVFRFLRRPHFGHSGFVRQRSAIQELNNHLLK